MICFSDCGKKGEQMVESDIRPVDESKFWHCTSPILPLVYGDSLTYLEDLSKLVAKVNECVSRINSLGDDIYNRIKAYTDEELAKVRMEVTAQVQELTLEVRDFERSTNQQLERFSNENQRFRNELIQTLNQTLAQFEATVNARLNQQDIKIQANYIASQAYTNLQVANLREEVLEHIEIIARDIRVLNMFTGEYVTLQEMFDYLGMFHVEGAISIQQIVALERLVNTVVGYDATCTEMVINGYNIFNEL